MYLLDLRRPQQVESLELCRPVLQQGPGEKWLKEGQARQCSRSSATSPAPVDLLLSPEHLCPVQNKRREGPSTASAEAGHTRMIPLYAKKVACSPNYPRLAEEVVQAEPRSTLCSCPLLLLQARRCQALPDQKFWRLTLMRPRRWADAILSSGMFTHYDRQRVANLCEKVALFSAPWSTSPTCTTFGRAIGSGQGLSPRYFGTLSPSDSMDCLKAMAGRESATEPADLRSDCG
uniref:Protein kinase domain-containing protein n=1 Tax=Macrostomum lignano TaxID=282301 RepID=A0A1I8FBH9_9PLAT